MQAPPPRSLQELLERQWEQTAQFILDQAGKQNNGGCGRGGGCGHGDGGCGCDGGCGHEGGYGHNGGCGHWATCSEQWSPQIQTLLGPRKWVSQLVRRPDFRGEIHTDFYCIGTKQSVLSKQDVLISGCPHFRGSTVIFIAVLITFSLWIKSEYFVSLFYFFCSWFHACPSAYVTVRQQAHAVSYHGAGISERVLHCHQHQAKADSC